MDEMAHDDRVLAALATCESEFGRLAVAWLRAARLIKQQGRQGYPVVSPATFETDIERFLAIVPSQDA